MKYSLVFLLFLFAAAVTGCWEDGGVIRNNDTNNNNVTGCEGEAPLGDIQEGVCAGISKVCDPVSHLWVEPDYSILDEFEATETTCDTLDNDCDGVVDETCGVGVQPNAGDLVVSEIMILPSSPNPMQGQYFEILNTTDATINLADVGFLISSPSADATSEVGRWVDLAPQGRFVVGSSESIQDNGGVEIDHLFGNWLELSQDNGRIELYRLSDGVQLDTVAWDGSWMHSQGASLILSPDAPAATAGQLNDNGAHWCRSRFSVYGSGGKGTPGASNDHCLVEWCSLYQPVITQTDMHLSTVPLYGRVMETGITGNSAPPYGDFLMVQIGHGPEDSIADDGWTWGEAVVNDGFVDSDYDEFIGTFVIEQPGIFDYTFRVSMDGGLSYLYCDSDGVHGHSGSDTYAETANGDVTVTETAPRTGWVVKAGGSTFDEGRDIGIDDVGNLYITGRFSGSATFGTTTLVSAGGYDMYVAKIDPYGNFLWAISAGGLDDESGYSIAVDGAGSSYVTGFFSGAASFGTTTLSATNVHLFVTKVDTNGNFQWATQSDGEGPATAMGVGIDGMGNSYVVGNFYATTRFGATELTVVSHTDVFITKLDTDGNFEWAKGLGGINTDTGFGVAVDSDGNSMITGRYRHTVQVDATDITALADYDLFVIKLDQDGNYLWAVSSQGGGAENGQQIALDQQGNGYLTGYYSGTVQFGATSLTSTGGFDCFITKVDSDGNFAWATSVGGTSHEIGWGITVDTLGQAYVTGKFSDSAAFGATLLTSEGLEDLFITKLDPAGVPIWAVSAGGSGSETGYGIVRDSAGRIYITGKFHETALFLGTPLVSNGEGDVAVAQFIP